jgi:hypothetical protein
VINLQPNKAYEETEIRLFWPFDYPLPQPKKAPLLDAANDAADPLPLCSMNGTAVLCLYSPQAESTPAHTQVNTSRSAAKPDKET